MRYAITNLSNVVPADDIDPLAARSARWMADLKRWSEEGLDFVQLREKDLDAGEVFRLAASGVRLFRKAPEGTPSVASRTRVLINGRPDIAIAGGADGVHLPARVGGLRPDQVRRLFRSAGLRHCIVSVSCHSLEEVTAARNAGADLILFGPVFEKRVQGQVVIAGRGLEQLARAAEVAGPVPLLALGGVTGTNSASCLEAGAAGIAAIRLFS